MAGVELLGGLAQAGGMIYAGASKRDAYKSEASATERAAAVEAAGLRQRAAEERAAGYAAGRERSLATEKVIGRQVAVGAASGAGASSGTILDIIGETAARGEEQRLAEVYKGESGARGLEDKASMSGWQAGTRSKALRQKGDAALTGSIFEGGTKAAGSIYKYGDREGWWADKADKPDSDETNPVTNWRTRVYKAKR